MVEGREAPNTNANTHADSVTVSLPSGASFEGLPVASVATALGVTLPRLQRLLKSDRFAPHVHKGERKTRTGTRTVTVVSVSVLDALKEALVEAEGEQKRKHSHGEALPFAATEGDQRHAAAIELLTREYRERIEEQSRTIADLRADKQELKEKNQKLVEEREREHSRAEALLLENEKLKALPPMVQTASSGASGGDSGASGVPGGASAPPAQREGVLRGFLRRWW